jgi:hypothetical protein
MRRATPKHLIPNTEKKWLIRSSEEPVADQ